jgi:hypothetical protein
VTTASTRAFLERLPDGLASYRECQAKISVIHAWVEGHDLDKLASALPDEIDMRAILRQPATAWVSEVEATAIYLTVRDVFFESDDAYVDGAHTKNVNLLRNPLYRVLARLFSPERIQKAGSAIFARLHRGIVSIPERRGDALLWTLEYPPHLVPELIARCYGTALAAALELSGSPAVPIEIDTHTPTRTVLRVKPVW